MKTSSLILILGPLILIGIIGFALHDTSIKNISAGLYSDGADMDFKATMIQKLEARSIEVILHNNLQNCKQAVKNDDLQFCIELGAPTINNFEQENQNIILHVDFSKQRTVWNLIGQVQEIVGQETEKQRSVMINNLKSEMDTIKESAERNKATIENAILTLKTINLYLDESIKKGEEIDSKLASTSSSLGSSINALKSFRTIAVIALIPTNDLDASIESLEQSQNTIQEISELTSTVKLVSARDKVAGIITQLTDAKNDIEEISDRVDSINNEDFDKLINPITLEYESVLQGQSKGINVELQFLDYLFPSFLIFFMLFNSIIFSASTRLKERKSSAYIRNIVSGVKQRIFIFGDFITSVIIISIQTFAILFLASFFLNISIMGNIVPLVKVVVLSISMFALIGLTIGSIFNNQETVIITSISLSLLLFIFSSLITPIETLPSLIAGVVKVLPLTLFEAKLRLVTIFNLPLNFSGSEVLGMTIFTIISIALIGMFSRKNKRKLI